MEEGAEGGEAGQAGPPDADLTADPSRRRIGRSSRDERTDRRRAVRLIGERWVAARVRTCRRRRGDVVEPVVLVPRPIRRRVRHVRVLRPEHRGHGAGVARPPPPDPQRPDLRRGPAPRQPVGGGAVRSRSSSRCCSARTGRWGSSSRSISSCSGSAWCGCPAGSASGASAPPPAGLVARRLRGDAHQDRPVRADPRHRLGAAAARRDPRGAPLERPWRAVAGMSAVTAAVLLAGHPQLVYETLLLAVAATIGFAIGGERWRRLPHLAGGAALGGADRRCRSSWRCCTPPPTARCRSAATRTSSTRRCRCCPARRRGRCSARCRTSTRRASSAVSRASRSSGSSAPWWR